MENMFHGKIFYHGKIIFHVIPNFMPGGAENQLKLLVEESLCYKHVIISIKNNANIFEESKIFDFD